MQTYSVWFEDAQEYRNIPGSEAHGKELRGSGMKMARAPGRVSFNVPGYAIIYDEGSGRLIARKF